MIVAQGQAAKAAALGKTPPHPPSFFFSFRFGAPRARQTGRKKGEKIALDPQPRAALLPRWAWATILGGAVILTRYSGRMATKQE
jgi:hypothetical protein